MKKLFYVIIKDSVEYVFDPAEYTQEEAERKALEWWDERKPEIHCYLDEEDS